MTEWSQRKYVFVRIGLAIAYAIFLYGVGFVLYRYPSDVGGIAALTGFPFFYGTAVQSIYDPKREKSGFDSFLWGLLPLGIFIIVLLFFGIETLVCVAIAALPFLILMSLGIWLTRCFLGLFDSPNVRNRFNASVVVLPMAFIPFLESLSFPKQHSLVATEIIVQASVDEVWSQLVEIPRIEPAERIWTFSHNVLRTPQPLDAVLEGHIRQLRWTKGVRFQEHITQSANDRFLAWRFVFNEPETLERLDPHISPDGEILRLKGGHYTLIPEEEGRSTRLRLETHYYLKTPINFYLEFWGNILLQDFHQAVLAVVKTRSERRASKH